MDCNFVLRKYLDWLVVSVPGIGFVNMIGSLRTVPICGGKCIDKHLMFSFQNFESLFFLNLLNYFGTNIVLVSLYNLFNGVVVSVLYDLL